MHCGYCRAAGHNRSGCAEYKAAISRENQPQSAQRKGKGPAEENNTSSRGKKRTQSSKMREHVEQLMEAARRKKSKHQIDENGDIDYPIIRTVSANQNIYFSSFAYHGLLHIMTAILQHINKRHVAAQLDPQHQKDSMVHILSHEVNKSCQPNPMF